jgi:serine/threonine-protein kinase
MAAQQGPSAERVRAGVQRILASNHFVHAESLSNLLKYIVEQALEGKSQSLKEYTLGVEVFHRGAEFNSKEDTIVRVQARALRSRLESYYQTDGRKDPIRVIVPKGTYVPTFELAIHSKNAAFGSKRIWVWVAAAVIATGGLAWYWSARHKPSPLAGCRTLAVLPFDTHSAPNQGFIGPALAQELVLRLSEVPGLTLISFASTSRHKRSGRPLAELNAGCVVEGSLRHMGDEVEVDASLKDGTSGRTLWRQSYHRSVKDMSKLEAELSDAIASEALPNPHPVRASGRQPPAIDAEAALLYLEARYEFNKYQESEIRRSIELYEHALRRQPDYALAHAGLALAWLRLANYFVPPNEGMPKARTAAQRALELAPDLAEAHAVMAAISLVYDWRPTAAHTALQRAIAIAPSLPLVNEIQALYNISIGRFEEAFANLRIAREQDPLSIPLATFSQFGLLVTRRYRDAAEPGLHAVAREPNAGLLRTMVGLNLIYGGRKAEGVEHLDSSMRIDQSSPVALLAAAGFARAGDEARARRVLADVKGRMPRRYVCAYEVASVHAALSEPDEAFVWLDKAKRDRCDCMLWLNIEPWFDGIRGHPRFAEFIRQVALEKAPG